MQRQSASSTAASDTIASRAAASGFIPPSWSDLSQVIQAAVGLWSFIVVFAIARAAFRRFLQTEYFRRLKERQKDLPRHSQHVLYRTACFFRNIRIMLVRNRYPETTSAFLFGLPRSIAGLIVCVLYIVNTYVKGIPTQFYVFQFFYGIAISVNLMLSFAYAERPLLFAFSLRTAIEALSIPSLLLSFDGRWLNFNFLQAYCILAEWAVLEKHDIVMRNTSTLTRLLTNLFLQLLTFLFLTSCGVQFFELLGDPSQVLRSETFQITWANSVYFAVVTLMTVGYGDFVPYTLFGRMWIVFHIIFAAYLVSREISLLIDALKSMRRGGGSYVNSSGTDHVVVTGKVKWEFLQQFVKEFLAEGSNLDTRIIVLTSNPTWSDDEWHKFVSHNPLFDHHLMYLDGSALKMDDLGRAQVGSAKGVFVLADPHRQDPYREDSDILKAVLTIRNYSGQVPIYALNTLVESSFQFGIAAKKIHRPGNAELLYDSTFNGQSIPPSPKPWSASPDHALTVNRKEVYWSQEDLLTLSTPEVRQNAVLGPSSHGMYPSELRHLQGSDHESIDEGILTPRSRRTRKREHRVSESLCMQEIETVLLAENTFCNGLSTLIANATLRIAPQSSRNDRPWLVEYKLGAECGIQEFLVRREMDGIKYGKIATILQDYGLILLAVRENSDDDWSVLKTDTVLKGGMSTMAMTYHDPIVIDRIADLAARYIEKHIRAKVRYNSSASGRRRRRNSDRSRKRLETHSRSVSEGAPSDGMALRRAAKAERVKRLNAQAASESESQNDSSAQERDVKSELSHPGDQRSRNAGNSSLLRSNSTSTAGILKKSETGEMSEGLERLHNSQVPPGNSDNDAKQSESSSVMPVPVTQSPTRKPVYTSVDKLPAALRGHVIICLEGESPLLTVEALLRRIWIARTGQKKKAPVVVIHPRFPKTYIRTLHREGDHLFLLQGNSLSLETLRQAQFQSARAVLIITSESDEAKGQGSTDSKAIFTVMTLDSLLAGRDTFVCCILDAEESLQLLRAPRQPRRVGVNLGEQREPDVFNLSAYYERSAISGGSKRPSSSTLFKSRSLIPFTSEYGRFAPYGTFGHNFGVHEDNQRSFPSRSGKAMKLRLKGMSRSNSMRVDGDSSDEEYHSGLELYRIPEQHYHTHYHQQMSREELYERQRYASGEMVISSLFTALLARDYTDPGYIRLIRQLIGASSSSAGSWIRQVEIPESWTRAKNEIDGRTYRDTSIKLLKMGCISLGLYRSGDAPVRIETQSDQWERRADEVVYYEEEDISMLRRDAESRSVASRIVDRDEYAKRRHGRVAVGRGAHEIPMGKRANDDGGTSFHERFAGDHEDDAFDRMYYTCPTTRRKIYYKEAMDGANVLPYVYSCPEPYSLVAASDAVFVLCDPKRELPVNWDED